MERREETDRLKQGAQFKAIIRGSVSDAILIRWL